MLGAFCASQLFSEAICTNGPKRSKPASIAVMTIEQAVRVRYVERSLDSLEGSRRGEPMATEAEPKSERERWDAVWTEAEGARRA